MDPKFYLDDGRPLLGVDEVMVALFEHQGNVGAAALAIERPRHRVQKLINETPTLQMFLMDLQETRIDKAEQVIDHYLNEGDFGAARLVVTTQGKQRGWTQRSEVTGKDGGAVTVVIEGPDANL